MISSYGWFEGESILQSLLECPDSSILRENTTLRPQAEMESGVTFNKIHDIAKRLENPTTFIIYSIWHFFFHN